MSSAVKGHFTIDLARAREKLGKYQLVDPYAYVLELVKTAVLRGTESIEIYVDTDDLRLTFQGQPFREEELQNLELAVLEDCATPLELSRKSLAMALLAAQSLDPKSISILSGAGYRWHKSKGKAAVISDARNDDGQNIIHVKMPWTLGVLLDRFRTRMTPRPEEVLLRKHCRTTQIEIVHNGETLTAPLGPNSVHNSLAGVSIEGVDLQGWGGLLPGQPAELRLIVSGVEVEKVSLENLGPVPFSALVEAKRLTTDISGASVQRDSAFDEVWRAVHEARGRSLTSLAAAGADKYREQLTTELFGLEEFNTKGDLNKYPTSLMRCEIWKLTDGRNCSLLDLQEIVDECGFLPFGVEQHLDEQLEDIPGVLHADVNLKSKVHKLTGWSTKNVTRRLRQQAEAKQNLRAWKARKTKALLPAGDYALTFPLGGDGIGGEIGVSYAPDPPLIRVVAEGCLLCELSPEEWPKGVVIVLEGDFQPLRTYDAVFPDALFLKALGVAATQMKALYEALAEDNTPRLQPILADFVRVASEPKPVRTLLGGCGLDWRQFESEIEEIEWPSLLEEVENPLLDVAWVKTEGEKSLSVRELKTQASADSLVISENQKETIERLLGQDFLETDDSGDQQKPRFRLDPKELREERLMAALRRELSRVIKEAELRLGGFNLSRLMLADKSPEELFTLSVGGVHLHRAHPLISAALQQEQPDPNLLLLLVSVLFSAINRESTQMTDAEERHLQHSLVEYMVTSPARLSGATEGEPRGVMQRVDADGMCTGWANDPAGLGLRLYLQEPGPGDKPIMVVPLDSPREEGGDHFLFELPPAARTGDRVLLHACLVHPTDGHLVELDGCPRAFAQPHEAPAKPIGEITHVTPDGLCKGWCVDPNDPLAAPQLEFYLDGYWKEGEWLGLCKANIPNAEIEQETGFRGCHGFEFQIPDRHRDGCRHTLHVYAFDLDNVAGNPLLEGSPLEFVLAPRHREGDDSWLKGRKALEAGNHEDAIKHLKLRIEQGGDRVPDDEVWSWLGAAYTATERLKEADNAYQQAIKLAPTQSEHWYFAGVIKAKLGHDELALKRYRTAIGFAPDYADALIEVARRTNEPEEAIKCWETLLSHREFPQEREALEELLTLYYQLGMVEQAESTLERALDKGFNEFREIAKLARKDGIIRQTLAVSTAAEEDHQILLRAQTLNDQGEYEESLGLLKGIMARNHLRDHPATLWSELGRANVGLHRYKSARMCYSHALTHEPNNAEILCDLGEVALAMKDNATAERHYREALAHESKAAWAQLALAEFLIKQGREDEAIEHLEKCLELDEDGKYERAREILENLAANK